MATLIFSVIGSTLAGPIGGAIGALVGQQVDKLVLGGGGGSREGPRLKELSVTTSSYGSPIPRVVGSMRLAGTIVWSTDLQEHKDKQGGGKGKPSITTYSYTASLAVLLASRALSGIGRIWADGNLLRGAAGDMKVGGKMRFYSGSAAQAADPLMAAAEGAGNCPAYRGSAYVVFEDLQLADFGNRIPALTFEVLTGDTAITLAPLFTGILDDVVADVPLAGVAGITCEGALVDLLAQLDPAFPIDCDVSGTVLTIQREAASSPRQMREAAVAAHDDGFGAKNGFVRKRLPPPTAQPGILRYYDLGRDFQPGLQRAPGRPRPGQPTSVELPVAMAAEDARGLVAAMVRRAKWARQTIAWRTAELDPDVVPGALVTLPGEPGMWRVSDWEWRDQGIEVTLVRSYGALGAGGMTSDPGRINAPVDALSGPTVLAAYELPWDGTGSGDSPLLFAAASSSSAGWSGAALFADHGDGQLIALGSTGRVRATMGHSTGALAPGNPNLIDRISTVTVQLAGNDLALTGCTTSQLASGANRALIGAEIIQFANAEPLGAGLWRLSGLLRGRGGTEAAINGHVSGEAFVLLDGTATALDPSLVGDLPQTLVSAIGMGDVAHVTSAVTNSGVTRRPLSPIRARVQSETDGSLSLAWTRRARGAWTWLDGVDAPLHEQSEAYEVVLGPLAAPLAAWNTASPALTISAAELASLSATASGQPIQVRQKGSYALSSPLYLASLA